MMYGFENLSIILSNIPQFHSSKQLINIFSFSLILATMLYLLKSVIKQSKAMQKNIKSHVCFSKNQQHNKKSLNWNQKTKKSTINSLLHYRIILSHQIKMHECYLLKHPVAFLLHKTK